ncbi:MAG: outer membrane protein assembly factor BamA [Saprospiraceae bacterium]|nr:outer membrane protein assembly factor BamA [Saprospiraceae bacterium]
MIHNRLLSNTVISLPMQKTPTHIILALTVCILMTSLSLKAQTDTVPLMNYETSSTYEIGGITVEGNNYSDENAIISVAGLKVGKQINVPGVDIRSAIRALWKLKLFTDIRIIKERTAGDLIFLKILVTEKPRLARYSYKGVKKSDHDDLNEVVSPFLVKGGIITDNVIQNTKNALKKYYQEEGYLDVEVDIVQIEEEKVRNSVRLLIDIDRNDRVKIQKFTFSGNESIKSRKLRKQFEHTKQKSKLFTKSKFVKEDWEADKDALINYYNTIGYRDAKITKDSIWREDDGDLRIDLDIYEGNRYYFRNITWKGNSIHSDERLSEILGIEKGDIYNEELLQTRLSFSLDGRDVSTLYMDDGYLFFNVEPVEIAIVNDSIDLEMRIFEGPQATIDRVVIKGNDRTHEHVIRRELRTKPGHKFSRTDIIRSQREIVNLGYFNPENLGINTPVNQQRGTVDIEYTVEERPSDQLELSAGWGGFQGLIGTLGVSFNNFSLRNISNKKAWSPLPTGDGQKLSLRGQTNGQFFQSYNFSFTEPWLGGKKPNSFTLGGFYNKFDRSIFDQGSLSITQLNVGLGTRLRWPDDNFLVQSTLNLQNLRLEDYIAPGTRFFDNEGNPVGDGSYNNFSFRQTIVRSSVADPLFPRSGSKFSLSVQFTLPYSLFNNKDYSQLDVEERFKWLEYHKWRFDAEWYFNLFDKFVLMTQVKTGFLGYYNKDIGAPPFERYVVGGDGFANQNVGINGRDLIALRGYEVDEVRASNVQEYNEIQSRNQNLTEGDATVFAKYTMELRYPVSLNPNSTIYAHAFLQGGNMWHGLKEYNPFDVKRSGGLGVRVFLPMFGMLGFDYGIGFDKPWINPETSTWTDYGRFNIILGFEPD